MDVELQHLRNKISERTSLLAKAIMCIKEIGEEHFLAVKFLEENQESMHGFAREYNDAERGLQANQDSGFAR